MPPRNVRVGIPSEPPPSQNDPLERAKVWSMTPLLPPPGYSQPMPQAAGWQNYMQWIADKGRNAAYNWVVGPMSSPLGIATTAASPFISRTAMGLIGAGMGGYGAYQEGKQGRWLPSVESPGAVANVGLGALSAWSTMPRSPKTPASAPKTAAPEAINAGRRQFLQKAAPVAGGIAVGAPAVAKLAGKIAKSTAPAAAATEGKLVGVSIGKLEPFHWRDAAGNSGLTPGGYGISKSYKLPDGSYRMEMVAPDSSVTLLDPNSKTPHGHSFGLSEEQALKIVPERALREVDRAPLQSKEFGESYGRLEADDGLYVTIDADDPIVPSQWTYQRIDHVHPRYGELIDLLPEGSSGGGFEALYLDPATGSRTKVIAINGASEPVLREYLGDVVVDKDILRNAYYGDTIRSSKAYTGFSDTSYGYHPDTISWDRAVFIDPDGKTLRVSNYKDAGKRVR